MVSTPRLRMIYSDKDNPSVWYQVKRRLVEAVLWRKGFDEIQRTDHTPLSWPTPSMPRVACARRRKSRPLERRRYAAAGGVKPVQW